MCPLDQYEWILQVYFHFFLNGGTKFESLTWDDNYRTGFCSCKHVKKFLTNMWTSILLSSPICLQFYLGKCCYIPGGPKNGTVNTVDFQDFAQINSYLFFSPCWIEHLFLIIITPRSSNLVENLKKKIGWELFILWVISYGLSFSGFAWFPEFRGTINDSFSSTCANTYQHSTSYKEISVPMTCLDCKSLFIGNTLIIEHNTRSIYGWPKLSLIVPRNSGNQANPENDSP